MLHLILFGPPGAGKGTQAQLLGTQFGLIHISTGDLLRSELANRTELGLEAKRFMDRGELVPDETVISMIMNRIHQMSETGGVIYDGFPRTIPQAEALDRILKSEHEKISALISLEVPHNELVKRLMLRGETSGRSDDRNISVIENRIKVYQEKTKPLIDYYNQQQKYHTVDGTGTIEQISQRLTNLVEKIKNQN